ncbi:MAG: DUF930 domain-containing protein [Hyphomicrobiaceae bacterium]
MKGRFLPLVALVLAAPTGAVAGPMDKMLKKLAPEERAHQACILRGFDIAQKEKRLRGADRMKTSIFSRALLQGTTLNAKGGAVRMKGHWYAMGFTCTLTDNFLKATTFSYDLGAEIGKKDWDRLGLW